MTPELVPVITAVGLGLALAGAPGPVQAVILGESLAGGVSRGLGAVAGASATFGALLLAAALGWSAATIDGLVLRILQLLGGAFLLWLAWDGWRSLPQAQQTEHRQPPALRGALAVLLNPGAWLFIGAVASPLLLDATLRGGTGLAALTAAGLAGGAAGGDAFLAVLGGSGLRRAGERVVRMLRRGLVLVLAVLGLVLLVNGAVG